MMKTVNVFHYQYISVHLCLLSLIISCFSSQDDIQARLNKEQKRKDATSEKWEVKVKDLQATVQRNESVIQMLKTQLQTYKEQAEELVSCTEVC